MTIGDDEVSVSGGVDVAWNRRVERWDLSLTRELETELVWIVRIDALLLFVVTALGPFNGRVPEPTYAYGLRVLYLPSKVLYTVRSCWVR